MKLFFTIISFFAIASSVNANMLTITCQNNPSHFLPVTLNATVGDTIHWTWVTGNHVVGPIISSDIPSGAAMFNSIIDASHLSFEYVVTVAGDYHYVCHPATPHGEDAYITVSNATGVTPQINSGNKFNSVYPNPSNGKFLLAVDNSLISLESKVEIYNLQGQIIYQSAITNTNSEIDLSDETKGIYFLEFYNGQTILTKRIAIQ